MKLIKTLVIALVVAALVIGIAAPVLAAPGNGRGPAVSVNMTKEKPDREQVRVKANTEVLRGIVQQKLGDVLKIGDKDVLCTRDTRFQIPGVKDARLADIKEGMYVVAQTTRTDGKYTARQVVVVPGRSVKKYTGKVTQFSYTPPASGNVTATATNNVTIGGSLTIQEKSGHTVRFDIIQGRFTVRPKGDTVDVGDNVTVAARQGANGGLVALGVVIQHPVQQVTGNVTAIDEVNQKITVGTVTVKYDGKTLFQLHGVPGLRLGQAATAFYREQPDKTLLANRIVVKAQ